jgi:polysaccharide biosynthesis protein PslH
MRSVLVTKFVPHPPNAGGKLRSLAVLRRLAAAGEVVLCCFDDDSSRADELRAEGIDVRTVPWRPGPVAVARGVLRAGAGTAGRFYDPALAGLVRQALAEAPTDVLQVEYSHLAPYLTLGPARLKVLDLHNVESALAASFAASRSGPGGWAARLEARLLRRVERRAVEAADLVLVVSEADRARLPGRPRDLLVCPNGWDPGEPLPPAAGPVAVFVALLGWRPNADAAVWLAREVWPRVRRALPGARLVLVGRDPAPDVRALAADDVEVTGTVPDVRPHLAAARVALAPLRAGGGTRLKVLEALDAGRPVVSTSVGIDGLTDLVGHGVVVADAPEAFADAVVTLLADPVRAEQAGRDGSEAVRERYAWDTVLAPWLDRIAARVAP